MTNVQGTSDGELGKLLTLQYANLNGLKCKKEELKARTEKGEVHIGCFVETWADDRVTDSWIADLEKFNIDKSAYRELISVTKEFGLFQRVRGFTRELTSCLDLLFVTRISLVGQVNILPKLTLSNDHLALQCSVRMWTVRYPAPSKPVWVFETGSQHVFGSDVASYNWKPFFITQCNSEVSAVNFEAKLVEV
ncbi:hypothetical protein RvY_03738 [Ramazzottius varieornatus]|uniref:Endonuclease/exonuclease/phosphatase domain-containing protein n=1 Tax=Ramazzottius varieornatus TaxID=947166 RepID=A0A1D1UP41_RAMVA|nr:hypothetical protein RvY_03738 [Ramazzottius varieornatus]